MGIVPKFMPLDPYKFDEGHLFLRKDVIGSLVPTMYAFTIYIALLVHTRGGSVRSLKM